MLQRASTMMTLASHTKVDLPGISEAMRTLARNQEQSPGLACIDLQCAILDNIGGNLLTVHDDKGIAMSCLIGPSRLGGYDESFVSPLSPGGQPAVRIGADAAVAALVRSLRRPLILREVRLDGEFVGHLESASANWRILRRWHRASLLVRGSFESWLTENFDHKRRKEMKRLRARLQEQGVVAFEQLQVGEAAAPWIEQLLHLEASGWKARKGTALAQTKAHATALNQGLSSLHAEGKLRFWRITKDGSTIASLFAVVENGQATLGKIAYDESFAKFSPGVLAIMYATEMLFGDPDVSFADSNAIPDHPMINRLWRDRMEVGDIVIGPANSRWSMVTVGAFDVAKFNLRSAAKKLLKTIRKGRKP
jgi:Acetyltransferase (GNAT) domain